MDLKAIARTHLGGIVSEHVRSLPTSTRHGRRRHWPWALMFVAVPATGTAAVAAIGASQVPVATSGLLAGVGVLSGLLFQVLAWVSGRIASLADGMGSRAATPYELRLIRRLDIARANIAYASLVSILFVIELGTVMLTRRPPMWLNYLSAFLLLHLATTLLLVLSRINSIGQDDRVAALTAHARDEAPIADSVHPDDVPVDRPPGDSPDRGTRGQL